MRQEQRVTHTLSPCSTKLLFHLNLDILKRKTNTLYPNDVAMPYDVRMDGMDVAISRDQSRYPCDDPRNGKMLHAWVSSDLPIYFRKRVREVSGVTSTVRSCCRI